MSVETVTLEQQEALIDFMERHKELALGRFSRTKEGRSLSKRLWVECAGLLNSVSANCPTRGAYGWRTYFTDYKSKLLKKFKRNKQELSATGGGQYSQIQLTALQERLYTILGRDVGEPLSGVRQNPLDVTFQTDGGDDGEENIIEVAYDEESPATIPITLSGHEWPMDMSIMEAMDTTNAVMATTSAVLVTTSVATATITAAPVSSTAAPATSTAATATITSAMATRTAVTATITSTTATSTAATATITAATATTSSPTTVPRRTEPARRRRRYNHREREPEMTPLEAAEQRLAAMESRSADATFALARAIERLADALEGHSRRPIEVVVVGGNENQSRRRRRRIEVSSDSE